MFNFRHMIDLIFTLKSNAVLLNKISYAIVVFNFPCTFSGMLTVLRSIIVKITSEVARVNDSMWKDAEEKNCKKYLENFLNSTQEDFQSKV